MRKGGSELKPFLASVLTLAMTFTVSGCGKTESDHVTITYGFWQSNLLPYIEERIAAFETENPNIHVELIDNVGSDHSFRDYWTDRNKEREAGGLPDVFQMNATNVRTYANAGKLMALDSWIAETDTVDMDNFPSSVNEIYYCNAQQVGIPIDYDTIGLWYNKELFDRAGVEYPTLNWTWEEAMTAAEKIDALGDDIYGTLGGNLDQRGYYNTVAAMGGYINRDNRFGFDLPETRAGIQYWYDWTKYAPDVDYEAVNGVQDRSLFLAGKIGMAFGGDWEIADYLSDTSAIADQVAVTELPVMPNGKRGSVIHGKANVVSADTKYPEAALKLLAFLSTDESYQKLGETGKCIPAHMMYSDLFFEQYPDYDMGIFLRAAVDYASPYPSSSLVGWDSVVKDHMHEILSGAVTVEEGCDQITRDLTALGKQ